MEDHRDLFTQNFAALLIGDFDHAFSAERDLTVGDLARRGGEQTHDGHSRRRFACAGFANEAQCFLAADVQIQVVYRIDDAVFGFVCHTQVIDVEQLILVFHVFHFVTLSLCQFFSLGSSASRRPSPKRLSESTVVTMNRPGKIVRYE